MFYKLIFRIVHHVCLPLKVKGLSEILTELLAYWYSMKYCTTLPGTSLLNLLSNVCVQFGIKKDYSHTFTC